VHTQLRTLTLAVLLGASLGSGAAAHAQSQSINGSIRGVVTDPSGAPIAGVAVTLKNLDTGYTRKVATDAQGLSASVQNCIATGTAGNPGYNPCSNALIPALGSNYIAGQIISAPSLVPTSTLLEARILEFGLKIDF
jgi:hypothetical protein